MDRQRDEELYTLFNAYEFLNAAGQFYFDKSTKTLYYHRIDQNYVKGIPPATSGPTYGLHNDKRSAYITENDNVLDIDPGVKHTINCKDFAGKHALINRRTYAMVTKMGGNPPTSMIDAPL